MRTFKEAMKIRKDEEGSTGEKLARFLLGYRTTPHSATGVTPAEILIGRRLRTRLDILHPSLTAKMERQSKTLPQSAPRNLEIGDPVMVKDYRARKDTWVKGIIQMRLSPVTYRVQVGDLFRKRHVDQLRSLAGSTVSDVISRQPEIQPQPTRLEGFQPSSTLFNEVQPEETNPTQTSTPDPPVSEYGQELSTTVAQEPDKTPVTESSSTRRYPTRIRTKPKRLIDEV